MFSKLLNTILLLFSSPNHILHVDGGTSCVSLLSQRIAGQKEEEEDLEDGIVTGTIEGGTTVIEGEVAIGMIEEETFTAQSLTNEQLLLL